MKWWNHLSRSHRRNKLKLTEDEHLLIKELRHAHKEWETAASRLDFVIEQDEIDYSIFALGAAEKRYEMLLRQVKQMNVTLVDKSKGKRMEG